MNKPNEQIAAGTSENTTQHNPESDLSAKELHSGKAEPKPESNPEAGPATQGTLHLVTPKVAAMGPFKQSPAASCAAKGDDEVMSQQVKQA